MKKLYLLLLLSTFLGNAQDIYFPDATLKAKLLESSPENYIASDAGGNPVAIDTNGDGEIQLAEASLISTLAISNCDVANLVGISYFNNLTRLYISQTLLTSIDVNDLAGLQLLDVSSNPALAALQITGCSNLQHLYCNNDQLSFLDLSGLSQLTSVKANQNLLTAINLTGLVNLKTLECDSNLFDTLNVDGLPELQEMHFGNNQLSSVSISNLPLLGSLHLENNQINMLSLMALPEVNTLDVSNNQLQELNINNLPKLFALSCDNNHLTNLSISNLPYFMNLHCNNNQLTTLNLENLPSFSGLDCSHNALSTLNINQFPSISEIVNCSYNQIESLDLSGTNPVVVNCSYNQITNLDVTGLDDMYYLYCNNNRIVNLDCSTLYTLDFVNADDNLLETFNIKNGHNEANLVSFANNPTMLHVCEDSTQTYLIQQRILFYGYTNCTHGTDCSLLNTTDFSTQNVIAVYPNPADSELNIEARATYDSVTIYNNLGQFVLTLAKPNHAINVSSLPAGSYILKLTSDFKSLNIHFLKK